MSGSKIGFNFQTTNNLNLAQKNIIKEQLVSQDKIPQTDEYIVKRGDTLTEIAIKTGQNLQQLLKKNPQIRNPNRIRIGQHIEIGKPTNNYTVKKGDTLSEIAKTHHTTVGDILRANPKQIHNRNLIYPGQKLQIPTGNNTTPQRSDQPTKTKTETKVPTQTKPNGNGQNEKVETKPEGDRQPTVSNSTNSSTTNAETSVKGSLKLGANEDYRSALLLAQKRTGIDAADLASLINAEAAIKNGKWDANSFNRGTNAMGLTQFLPRAWNDVATTRGTLLNETAVQKGYVRQEGNKFVVVDEPALLALRKDPTLSIVSAAEYAKGNLANLEKGGYIPPNTSSDEKAKYMYFTHHEGLTGAKIHLSNPKTISEERAKNLLSFNE